MHADEQFVAAFSRRRNSPNVHRITFLYMRAKIAMHKNT
jgi:hypothetical protein